MAQAKEPKTDDVQTYVGGRSDVGPYDAEKIAGVEGADAGRDMVINGHGEGASFRTDQDSNQYSSQLTRRNMLCIGYSSSDTWP